MENTRALVYASGGTETLPLGVRNRSHVRKIGISLDNGIRSGNGLGLTISGESNLFHYKGQRFSWSE